MTAPTDEQLELLNTLRIAESSPFPLAIHGPVRTADAVALRRDGLVRWLDTNGEASFWAITDEGQKLLAELPQQT